MSESNLFNFKKKAEEAKWLIEDLVPLGHLCFLLAQSGAGKSYWLEALALHILFAKDFCGMPTNFGDVLIIDQDTPQDVLEKRILKISKGLGLEPKFKLRYFSMRGFTISNDTIPNLINEFNPILTLIDSLHSVCGRLNPNKTSDMSIWAKVKADCLTKDRTIFVSHHISEKSSWTIPDLMDSNIHISGMGNSALKQQADTEYILASDINKEMGKIENIYIRPVPKRQAITPKASVYKIIEPDKDSMLFQFGGFYEPDTSEEELDILLLFETTGDDYTVKEIRDKMGNKYGESAIRKALKSLESKNRLLMQRTRHNLFKYKLPRIE